MTKEYRVIQSDSSILDIIVDEIGICPLCSHAIDPQYIFGREIEYDNEEFCCILVFRCTHCKDVFVARYNCDGSFYNLIYLHPNKIANIEFSDEIKNVSPQFIKIYSQAQFAEQNNIDELCGIGYRKSLEFLIKDFLIKIQHKDESSIKMKLLAECIDLLDNSKLKKAAKGATWIGNDETHYKRRNVNHNITHLKKFIGVTASFIRDEIIYKEIETLVR